MMDANRCRVCGRFPTVTPYDQSVDGNHDRAASVKCRCGNEVYLDWYLYIEVERTFRERGRSIYAEPTAYLSREFTDALTDAVVDKWNRENGGVE